MLVQAIRARRPAVIAASALGLFAIAFAAVTGASFTSTGKAADSMAMAVMTGIALLCYAANLYLLPRLASQPATAPYPPGVAAGGAATGAGTSRV